MELKGNIHIDISPDQLYAYLVFTPGSEETWNEESISEVIREKQLPSISDKQMSNIAKVIIKDPKKQHKIVIAQGIEPERPIADEVLWEDIPLREDYKDEIDQFIPNAPSPVITQSKTEKKEIIKTVKKTSPLPFMPAKVEKVKTFETITFEERIPLNPTVLGYTWVKEDQKIGEIIKGKPGKPGKDVFNKAISPPSAEDSSLHMGKGVDNRKGDLFSNKEGILRYGNSWVEILDFNLHKWELDISKDFSTCTLQFFPGNIKSLPNLDEILQEAEKIGARIDNFIAKDDILRAIEESIWHKSPLYNFPLNQSDDSQIRIEISLDKLKAVLYLKKGQGQGKPLVLKDLGEMIKTSELKGLDLKKIQADILAFYKGSDLELRDYILCEGTAPGESDNTKLEYYLDFLAEKDKTEILQQVEKNLEITKDYTESMEAFPLTAVQQVCFVKDHQELAVFHLGKKGDNGKDVYGTVLASREPEKPEIKLLDNIKLHDNSIVATMDGLLEYAVIDEIQYLRIRRHKDAHISVRVSSDKMKASIDLQKAEGSGKPLTISSVKEALQEASVVKGLHIKSLQNAVKKAISGENIENLTFAFGKEPENAKGSNIQFKVTFASNKVKIDGSGKADFKHRDIITAVQKETLVALIPPPGTPGANGYTVTGDVLEAKQAPDLNLDIGSGIRQETTENGWIKLFADKSGELVYDTKQIFIKDDLKVKGNIDLKTGNIKFPGTIQISGSVTSGFYVFSGEDVLIGENVEAALVSADRNIFVKQGVIGGGKAFLRAKHCINAGFTEQSTLLSVADLTIQKSCLRCKVKTNGKLLMPAEGATLIGGETKVRHGINLCNIGNDKGVKTQVSFGQDYLIQDRIEHEEREVMKFKDTIIKLDTYMKQLEKENKKEKLYAVRKEKLKILKLIEKQGIRVFTLREKFEEHFDSEILINGTAYPGVTFESHGRYHEIASKKSNIKIVFNKNTGHIEEKSLE